MTGTEQSEAHNAAAKTRALWREYLDINRQISMCHWTPDTADAVGRVVRLLREQRRILDELLGGNDGH